MTTIHHPTCTECDQPRRSCTCAEDRLPIRLHAQVDDQGRPWIEAVLTHGTATDITTRLLRALRANRAGVERILDEPNRVIADNQAVTLVTALLTDISLTLTPEDALNLAHFAEQVTEQAAYIATEPMWSAS